MLSAEHGRLETPSGPGSVNGRGGALWLGAVPEPEGHDPLGERAGSRPLPRDLLAPGSLQRGSQPAARPPQHVRGVELHLHPGAAGRRRSVPSVSRRPRPDSERESGQNVCGFAATSRTRRPGHVIRSDGNSLKHQSASVLPALASIKHTHRARTGALRELRETMIGLVGDAHQTLCVECIAMALGQRVGVVMMAMLGLHGHVASFQGVCSTCHRLARVIGRGPSG